MKAMTREHCTPPVLNWLCPASWGRPCHQLHPLPPRRPLPQCFCPHDHLSSVTPLSQAPAAPPWQQWTVSELQSCCSLYKPRHCSGAVMKGLSQQPPPFSVPPAWRATWAPVVGSSTLLPPHLQTSHRTSVASSSWWMWLSNVLPRWSCKLNSWFLKGTQGEEQDWLCLQCRALLSSMTLLHVTEQNHMKAWSFLFLVYQSNWGCFLLKKEKCIKVPWLYVVCSFHRHLYVLTCVSYLHRDQKCYQKMLPVWNLS